MNRWLVRGLLLFILLVAAGLRLTGLAWDGVEHYHPDERYRMNSAVENGNVLKHVQKQSVSAL